MSSSRHALADVAHRRQPEADRALLAVAIRELAREVALRRVHVGNEHRDLELAALVEVHRGLVEVRLHAREQRREVLAPGSSPSTTRSGT